MELLILTLTILAVGKPIESAFSYADACLKTCVTGTNIACEADTITLCANGIMINFRPWEIASIADGHNQFRNDIATGTLSAYAPASRMGTMIWDDELAAMADLNIRRCAFGYDLCSRTDNYPLSGQNLAYVKGASYATFNRNAVIVAIDGMIGEWFSQNVNANMTIIRKYQENGQNIKSFTNMIVGKNARVGCAAVWYPEDGVGRVNFGCNYAQGSLSPLSIYAEGATASKCTTGTDLVFGGLCSSSEPYSYNTSY